MQRKQISQLEVRERELVKMISGKEEDSKGWCLLRCVSFEKECVY